MCWYGNRLNAAHRNGQVVGPAVLRIGAQDRNRTYQETQSLPPQWRKKVLENEVRITGIFLEVLERLVSSGDLPHLSDRSMELIAHNISVLGHMWTFRRWFLARHYSIEDYIKFQTEFILGMSK